MRGVKPPHVAAVPARYGRVHSWSFMHPRRLIVFLPGHSLGDFPTWLDESEADELLSAFTAAWHPALITAVGRMPEWASIDMPPSDLSSAVGIVPAAWEDRFAACVDATVLEGSAWVRDVKGREAIVAAALAACGAESPSAAPLAADFHALGLAWLLAELLARRMRSATGLEASGFESAVVAAARGAVAGDEQAARGHLAECFAALETARSHYYPVDVWLLDLVLLAGSTLGASLDEELASPVPMGIVATGEVIGSLAGRNPAALSRLRERVAAGSISPVGGRQDARPLDLCTVGEIEADLDRGMAAWREHVGAAPATFGQIAGGSSAFLPGLLAARGYSGVIWSLFDGTSLPDPGAGRILWAGQGGTTIDAVARPPLDARQARSVLTLAERIGDAMDHDHTVVLQFAHYPGTASRWHDDLRRIGAWSKVFGEFVTPDDLFRRTSGAGATVDFPADAFPVTLPGVDEPLRDQVARIMAESSREAVRIAARDRVRPGEAMPGLVPQPSHVASCGWFEKIAAVLPGRRAAKRQFVLENGAIRVEVHEATGGLLSVKYAGDVGNRMSQRLALRTTRPAPAAGQPWEDIHERAVHSAMAADVVMRLGDSIESRGRLVSATNAVVGSFVQSVSLLPGRPLVLVDIEVQLVSPLAGPPLESYAACRFAWHENEMPDVRRSLHLEPVVTERWRFTAPHFVEICPTASRHERPPTQIFSMGMPWHVRSGEHMLDTILPADERPPVRCRLAIGVGIERPADVAIELMAAAAGTDGPRMDRLPGDRIPCSA